MVLKNVFQLPHARLMVELRLWLSLSTPTAYALVYKVSSALSRIGDSQCIEKDTYEYY
jgi:hypothetical protein